MSASAADSNATRDNPLSCLGRKSYVSQRALAQILAEIKELPEVPAATSRSSVKRAREKHTGSMETCFGPVMQDISLRTLSGACVKTPVLHPGAMLSYAAEHCEPFAQLLSDRLKNRPSTFQDPWRFLWYSDEVSPGNQLKHCNARKVQVIYYSLAELQSHALTCETMWFTLLVLRSTTVAQLGGMQALWRQLADLFFAQPDFTHGVPLKLQGASVMFYAKLGVMISDEAALKQTFANKGASGLIFCLACQNATDARSTVTRYADEGQLVSSLETNISKFRQHTPDSIGQTMRYLEEQAARLSKAEFDKLQTALGFNFRPDGLLAHPAYGPPSIACVMYDWFHIYLVHGIFNIHTGLFLGDLHQHGWKSHTIDEFANSFTWPARIRGGASKNLLHKRSSHSEALKCSASEGLNFLAVLRVFALNFVFDVCNEELKESCLAWLSLCRVLDALQAVATTPTQPAHLQKLIKAHLDMTKQVHGEGWWIPKCHLALHLPLQLHAHGCLLSCFVHERKHKIAKQMQIMCWTPARPSSAAFWMMFCTRMCDALLMRLPCQTQACTCWNHSAPPQGSCAKRFRMS